MLLELCLGWGALTWRQVEILWQVNLFHPHASREDLQEWFYCLVWWSWGDHSKLDARSESGSLLRVSLMPWEWGSVSYWSQGPSLSWNLKCGGRFWLLYWIIYTYLKVTKFLLLSHMLILTIQSRCCLIFHRIVLALFFFLLQLVNNPPGNALSEFCAPKNQVFNVVFLGTQTSLFLFF